MTRSALSLLPLLLVAAACGPATPEAQPPAASAVAPSPAPPESAAPATSASAAAAASAPPAEPAAPSYDVDGPDGIRRMARWEGPKAGSAVTTKKAWVIGPNTMGDGDKLSFSSVSLRLVDVEKSDGNEMVFKDHKIKYGVPAALAWPADAKGVKKGAVARCSFGGNTVIGRIEAADAKSVTCELRFMNKTDKEKMTPADIFALSGKLSPGAPALVAFESDPDARFVGMVVAVAGDDAWVKVDTQFASADRADRAVHKVKAANVTPIDVSKPLKVGDACVAAHHGARLDACKVGKVIDGGLAYVVTFEGDSGGDPNREWAIEEVAAGAKGVEKKK